MGSFLRSENVRNRAKKLGPKLDAKNLPKRKLGPKLDAKNFGGAARRLHANWAQNWMPKIPFETDVSLVRYGQYRGTCDPILVLLLLKINE